jgi:hypothetical protein
VAAFPARSEDRVGQEEAAIDQSAKGKGRGKAGGGGWSWLRLPAMVRDAPHETVMVAGLARVDEAPEAKRAALCGARVMRRRRGPLEQMVAGVLPRRRARSPAVVRRPPR